MTTATATRENITEPITRSEALSEQERVRLKVARRVNQLTNDGDALIQFMWDTVQGEFPDATFAHRRAAARDLAVMNGQLPQDTPGSAARVVREEDMPKPTKPKTTLKQIINKPLGEYIREETNDCVDLIDDYYDIMFPEPEFESSEPDERKYQKATQVRANHRVAALKEMMRRSIGCRNPYYYYAKTSALEEKMLNSKFGRAGRAKMEKGMGYVRYLFDIIEIQKTGLRGNILTDVYTQTHRTWALRELLHMGMDIPWEHITPESIDACFRELDEKERRDAERVLAWREESAATELTPEQKAGVLALFEESQRETDAADAKAAARAKKKAKKAAKKAAADKNAALNGNSAANRKNAGEDTGATADNRNGNTADKDNGKNTGDTPANADSAASTDKDDANNAATDTGNTDVDPAALTPDARGARAVANALARHPNVDLDTALENHHSTAGIPKENLTHEQIYDAITAEANFQKRQAIIQNRLNAKNPNAGAGAEDNDPPKSRSP